jgi:hypothetical protein
MDSLRKEIVESQKMRVDLMKWKLILIAGIGGVAIGLTEKLPKDFDSRLLLCLLPIANIYVDLMCRHLTLRILVIGRYLHYCYLNGIEIDEGHYEIMAMEARTLPLKAVFNELFDSQNLRQLFLPSAFGLEKFAVSWSSIIISSLLIVYALAYCPYSANTLFATTAAFPTPPANNNQTSTIIIWVSSLGILASIAIDMAFLIRKVGIRFLPQGTLLKNSSLNP